MKTSKIVIKNLFGIRETTLDGKSVEISGPKGAGKTSVLDAIRFALTNRSERDCIVHQGADEGEIIIETTTGLSIDRKALPAKSAGTVKVRDGSLLQTRPAEFLSQIFTPLQLNPVEFTQLSRQEKNRVILSLIEFDWDVNWIREQFGEIPQGVDYSKHILEVLNDIQAENGVYFQSRQNINRDIRNKQAFISDIAKDIPSGYDYDRWNQYPIGERYRELERLREKNSVIERAKAFRANFTSKLRGLEGSRDVEIGAIDRDIAAERAALTGSIERMKAELQATEEKLAQLSRRRQDRVDIATANFEAAKAKLEKDVGVAEQYADQEPVDTMEDYNNGNTQAGTLVETYLEEARALAEAQYDSSEAVRAQTDAENDMITAIRENTAALGGWKAQYDLSQNLTKGRAATWTASTQATGSSSGTNTMIANGYGYANVVPRNAIGYAVGIDYVPYDNFPALLHQGERVQTAVEARSEGSSGGIQIVMYGTTIREDADVDRVAAALLQKMELAGMRG